jgi:hypothetical protein
LKHDREAFVVYTLRFSSNRTQKILTKLSQANRLFGFQDHKGGALVQLLLCMDVNPSSPLRILCHLLFFLMTQQAKSIDRVR